MNNSFNLHSINPILEIVKNWAKTRSEILALALVGSYARGEATLNSDVDLMAIATNPNIFRQNPNWVWEIDWEYINYKVLTFDDAQYGVVWSRHIYLNRYTAQDSTNLTSIKIEISFGLPSWASVDPIDSGTFNLVSHGCQILYDSQAILTNLISKTSVAQNRMKLQKPDIAYIPCNQEIVEAILELAKMNSQDILYDLGSGDGRILITAAKKYGIRGVGIDIDPERIEQAKHKALKHRVNQQLKFYQQDLFTSNFADATVIFIYLLPHLNLRLRPQLWKQLKPGTKIISRDFDMGDWQPLQKLKFTVEEEEIEEQVTLYYWEISEQLAVSS